MGALFAKAIDQVLIEEGGYVNDSQDIGGETNFGISKREYPNLDIRNLTRVQAMKIYEMDYWTPNRLSEMTCQSIANALFDSIVNDGPRDTALIVQKALLNLGVSTVIDGVMGTNTISQINNIQSPGRLLDNIQLFRIDFYCAKVASDPTKLKYLRGWIQRTRRAV